MTVLGFPSGFPRTVFFFTLAAMEQILGHAALLEVLERATAHPAPGYAFHGPDGVGKRLVARYFAGLLLKTDPAQLAGHPDFAVLARQDGEKNIKVEAVRDLVGRMQLTAAMGGCKVALIEDAESMNEQGMNALLKAVEEPEGRAVFLFVTEQPERLPATLRSRLALMTLLPVRKEDIKAWLVADGADGALAEELAEACRGCPGLARRMREDLDEYRRRRAQATAFLRVLADEPDGRQVGEIERLAKTLQSADDPARAWQAFLSECERLAPSVLVEPARLSRFGEALIHARQTAGGAVSPALALEWGVVGQYHTGDVPVFLHPPYL